MPSPARGRAWAGRFGDALPIGVRAWCPPSSGKRVLERGGRALPSSMRSQGCGAVARPQGGRAACGLRAIVGRHARCRAGCRAFSASTRRSCSIAARSPPRARAGLVERGQARRGAGGRPAAGRAGLKRLRCGEQELVLVVRSDHALAAAATWRSRRWPTSRSCSFPRARLRA